MKKMLSILGGLFCFALCLFLLVAEFMFIVFKPLKSLASKETINKAVESINIKEVISFSPELTSNIYAILDIVGVSSEKADDVLNSKAIKEYLSNYLYDNLDNILNKNGEEEVENTSIRELLINIEKESGIELKNEGAITLALSRLKLSSNLSKTIRESVDDRALVIARWALDGSLIIAFIIIFIVIYALMCLSRFSIYKPLIWYGITTMVASIISALAFLGLSYIDMALIPAKFNKFESTFLVLIDSIKSSGILLSGIMFIIGIVMIILFIVIRTYIKNKEFDNSFDKQTENANAL